MAEPGAEPQQLADTILGVAPPHFGTHVKVHSLWLPPPCTCSCGAVPMHHEWQAASAPAARLHRAVQRPPGLPCRRAAAAFNAPPSLPPPPLLPPQAPAAVANQSIKAAAARLEREEMAASPTHSMKKRDQGGLASAVQARRRRRAAWSEPGGPRGATGQF